MSRCILFAILVGSYFLLSGCKESGPKPPPPRKSYSGGVTVNITDGKIVSVVATLPSGGNFTDRQEAEDFIVHLESILKDLKAAQDQMPILEPQIAPAPTK